MNFILVEQSFGVISMVRSIDDGIVLLVGEFDV